MREGASKICERDVVSESGEMVVERMPGVIGIRARGERTYWVIRTCLFGFWSFEVVCSTQDILALLERVFDFACCEKRCCRRILCTASTSD